jgi:starch-binding outer membrane protein, SusD/RagB family
MKLYKNFICVIAISIVTTFTACTGDLNVTPVDPNLKTPNNVLTSVGAYNQLLAKCYVGLAVSSPDGSSGNADITGIDGGFGQYLRALYNCEELPTDESVMCWNDQTVKDFHKLCWSSSDVFVTAMYSRLFYQIALCNEVIRQIKASSIKSDTLTQYENEARCLRALSYYHAIDLFGNVPFVTDESAVGGANPKQISRKDLFTWLTTEIKSFVDQLPANPDKYRCGQGMADMILAKLYLNAKVYIGTAKYDSCALYCGKIINLGYKLESGVNYKNMFGASNDEYLGIGHEIIFSVYQDETNTQTFGGTTYLMNAAIGGSMSSNSYGAAGGWGGLRVTPEYVDKFTTNDARYLFYTNGQKKDIVDISEFTNGYAYPKFTNLKDDGTYKDIASFCNADFPVFRLADVYLMLAECQVVGGVSVNINGMTGIDYFNAVRTRAGISTVASPVASDILDERARELGWECHRRSDLIRFNKLTTSDYLWSWKGGTKAGNAVDAKYNLFPIPSSDINSNNNLTQNSGY